MSRLSRLGQFAFRRRRLVLAAWVAALFSAFALSAALGGAFSADYTTPGSDSKAAADALESASRRRSPDTVDVVWRTADAARVDGFLREAETLPGLAAASEPEVSPDGQVAVARLPVTMPPADVPAATGERLLALGAAAHVELGGRSSRSRSRADLVGDRRPGRRRARAAGRARHRRGRRAAAAAGAVRARDRLRADHAAGRGDRHARLVVDDGGDARDRRRDRLRAADPHPLPRGAGRRRLRGGRDRRGGRHRGPQRARSPARPS